MAPSGDAIVYRPEETKPADQVAEYQLKQSSIHGVVRYPEQVITSASGKQEGDVTTLTFRRPLSPNDETSNFTFQDISSTASTTTIFAYGASNEWKQHVAQGSKSVNFASGGSSGTGIPTTHLVHGVLMFLSMGFMMPLGAMIARLGKNAMPDGAWFRNHRALQATAVVVMLGGFSLAVYFTTHAGYKNFSNPHGILGLIAVLLAGLQPLNAFIRPGKDGNNRGLWEVVHKGSGWIVPILAAANIFLGIKAVTQSVVILAVYGVFAAIEVLAILWLTYKAQSVKASYETLEGV